MPEPEDDLEQEALFDIEGPDEDGCVWICAAGGRRDIWCHNLGPEHKVAPKLSEWLSRIDYEGQP
ncbi:MULTISPECIES: hypothetical protein [Sphingomonas]|uniref:hypothetical protein n=1 Tax=Sphingomonas TaxID=13687 RepID=UPI00126A3574|nr:MULTISPECIES: hypothetical protein [Sphingomonas]